MLHHTVPKKFLSELLKDRSEPLRLNSTLNKCFGWVLAEETLPKITGNSTLNVQVGVQISATYTAIDARGNNIILNMTGLPAGATFNPQTGVFTWTPADLTPVTNLRY